VSEREKNGVGGVSLNAKGVEREELEVDVLLVGAGPAALSCAIDLKRRLDAAGKDAEAVEPAIQIPDLGDRAPALREIRTVIDDLDLELVRLLGRRARLARGAGRIKASHGHGVRDPVRERSLLADRRRWAEEEGLDPEAVDAVFRSVVRLSRGAQDESRSASSESSESEEGPA